MNWKHDGMTDTAATQLPETHKDEILTVSLREAFWTWARIAALSFGGPAGQIAVMHRIPGLSVSAPVLGVITYIVIDVP